MFIFQIDPAKNLTAEGNKGVLHSVSNPDSVLLNSLSQTPEVNPASPVKPSLEMLLGKIMDLSNEYIIYAQTHPYFPNTKMAYHIPPWAKSNELFETLAQYTGTSINNENVKIIQDFFYKIQIKKPSDPNKDGKLDHNDVLALWQGDKDSSILKEIKFLYHDVFADPEKHHVEGTAKLARALAKYTNTEYTVGKANSLLSGFNWANDVTGDGVLDYKDLIAYWKNLDDATPRFPSLVDIDFNHDGRFDYAMRNGKFYKFADNGRDLSETNSIPGVDMHELAQIVEKKFKESNYSDKVDFDMDINHDGIKDRIYSWDVVSFLEGQRF